MYDSGVTAKAFIGTLDEEIDIALEIPDASKYRWLSAVEQFVYTEVLKEYVSATVDLSQNETDFVDLSLLPVPSGAMAPTYDDVIRVFGENGQEIMKSGPTAAYEFPERDLYHMSPHGNIALHTREEQWQVTVVYRVRPAVKTEDNAEVLTVALPVEYLDMAGAKIRGEAYKIANEDGLAAKWLADYNQQMENFKIWAASRNERFGE